VSVVGLGAVALAQRTLWPAAALGIWAVYVLQQEVSQIVFAAPGFALMAIALLVSTHGDSRQALVRKLQIGAGAFGLGFAIYLLSLARHGQIGQWWEFVSTMGVLSNYAAWPADVVSWFSVPATLDQFLVFLTIILLVGGTLQAVWTRFRDVYLIVPAALGCVSVMVLQKQAVRAGIELQILAIPILGLGILTVQQLRLRHGTYRCVAWSAFSAGLVVSCFTLSLASNRDRVWSTVDLTSRLLPDLRYTLLAAEEWKPARDAYFYPSNGSFSPISRDEFVAGVRQLTGMRANDNIFVLGDSSDLYIVLRRPLPFYPNLYNQSPLFSQHRTMAWVKEHDPKFLFWNPQEREFDLVPNPVRAPLLYSYAVADFVPVGTVSKFDVMRRRLPNEPPAVAYWRDKLGSSLDLGYIPTRSRALSEAEDGGRYEMRYLIVRTLAPEEGKVYSVSLQLAGEPYAVRFNGRKGVTEYAVAIDRLPFAAAGDVLGRPPEVKSSLDAGLSARISTLRFSEERLY
jgi:hypothetical protein